MITIVTSLLPVACKANSTDLPIETPVGTEALTTTEKTTEALTLATTEKPTETSDKPTIVPVPTDEPTEPGEPEVTEPTTTVHTHSYTENVTKEATCTTEGLIVYTCISCGDTYTKVLSAMGHKMSGWIFCDDANYEEEGHDINYCLNYCGYEEWRVAEGTKWPRE